MTDTTTAEKGRPKPTEISAGYVFPEGNFVLFGNETSGGAWTTKDPRNVGSYVYTSAPWAEAEDIESACCSRDGTLAFVFGSGSGTSMKRRKCSVLEAGHAPHTEPDYVGRLTRARMPATMAATIGRTPGFNVEACALMEAPYRLFLGWRSPLLSANAPFCVVTNPQALGVNGAALSVVWGSLDLGGRGCRDALWSKAFGLVALAGPSDGAPKPRGAQFQLRFFEPTPTNGFRPTHTWDVPDSNGAKWEVCLPHPDGKGLLLLADAASSVPWTEYHA